MGACEMSKGCWRWPGASTVVIVWLGKAFRLDCAAGIEAPYGGANAPPPPLPPPPTSDDAPKPPPGSINTLELPPSPSDAPTGPARFGTSIDEWSSIPPPTA